MGGGGGVFRDLVLHKVPGEVREILTCMRKQANTSRHQTR